MKKILLFGFVPVCLLLFCGVSSADIVIDDFNDGADIVTANLGSVGPNQSSEAGLGVLGGTRTISVAHNSGGPSSIEVSAGFGTGVGAYSEGGNTNGEGFFRYDAGGVGLGGVDFSGEATIDIDVVFFDDGAPPNSIPVELTLVDGSANSASVATDITGVGSFSVALTDFLLANPLLDLSDIDAFQLSFTDGTSSSAQDININQISTTTTPEPTSILAWGIGMLGAGFAARRYRNRKAAKS